MTHFLTTHKLTEPATWLAGIALAALFFAGLAIPQTSFGENCPQGQFTCNVDEPFSTTCCKPNEVCGMSNAGRAQCTIPKAADRKPLKVTSEKTQDKTSRDKQKSK